MRGPLSLVALALAAAGGTAADPAGTITVTGSATLYVKPDTARIHYYVRVSDAGLDAAKHAAGKQVSALDDAIAGLKIGNVSTSAGAVSFSRPIGAAARRAAAGFPAGGPGAFPGGGFPGAAGGGPGGPGGGPPIAPIYQAQVPLTTTVREKDPAKLRATVDNLLKTIIDAGGSSGIDVLDPDLPFSASRASMSDGPRVEWLLEDDAAARRSALRTATERARADATTLSRELGWESLKVLSLVDGSAAARDSTDLSRTVSRTPAGEVAVSARVTLNCSR